MQPIVNVIAGLYNPYAFETITVADSAIGLTVSKYKITNQTEVKASRVVMTLTDAQIRYNYDGTAPTATTGHVLNENDVLVLLGDKAIDKFSAIRTGGTSGKLSVTYEQ